MITNISQRVTENGRTKFIVPNSVFVPRLHEVSRITRESAAKFVQKYHYSGTMPAARRNFGLFRHGELAGVAVFSHPVNDKTLTNAFGGEAVESLELGRFCLLDSVEFNAESWFIAKCKSELKKEGYRGIVAFSDDCPRTTADHKVVFAGHIGTIYAASNAVYTGRSDRNIIHLLPDGKVLSKRAISKIRNLERGFEYVAKVLIGYGAGEMPLDDRRRKIWLDLWLKQLTRRVQHPGNHKYLFPLQEGLNLPKSMPYPKVKYQEGQLTLF